MEIILASASPRRRELLGIIVPQFSCTKPDFDESSVNIADAKRKALTLSREKCKADFNLPPIYPRISRIQVISVVVPVTVRP